MRAQFPQRLGSRAWPIHTLEKELHPIDRLLLLYGDAREHWGEIHATCETYELQRNEVGGVREERALPLRTQTQYRRTLGEEPVIASTVAFKQRFATNLRRSRQACGECRKRLACKLF